MGVEVPQLPHKSKHSNGGSSNFDDLVRSEDEYGHPSLNVSIKTLSITWQLLKPMIWSYLSFNT